MSNYYNLEGIKKELEKRIDYNETLLKAWANVTFPTKKDGTPFKVMSKNFNGATYNLIDYAMQPNEYRLTVPAYSELNGYISDTINCYIQVKYLNDDDIRKTKLENYMPKYTMLEQIYVYDLEDIKTEVKNRIEYSKKMIEDLKKQLAVADVAYTEYKTAYETAVKNLKKLAGVKDSYGNALSYAILETVNKTY